jgi:hypothetical protein
LLNSCKFLVYYSNADIVKFYEARLRFYPNLFPQRDFNRKSAAFA